ncbi:MAG: hypothetical protein O3A46_17535, partial [Candidatus Poribacteria bacterium]|nr:hypothetical protein [Candidatus Poribacteria bacterium]
AETLSDDGDTDPLTRLIREESNEYATRMANLHLTRAESRALNAVLENPDLPLSEIAERCGIGQSNLKSGLQRARKRLKPVLSHLTDD